MIFDTHAHYDDQAFDEDREEALALCKSDFDWKRKEVIVNKAHVMVGSVTEEKETKSVNGVRSVPIPDSTRFFLESYVKGCKTFRLFTMRNGEPMTKSSYDKMWRRILVISVEDIGFGNTEAPHYVHTLYQISREFPYADGDQPIFFMQAIRFLCKCVKERTTDNIKNQMIKEWEHGKKPEIPDYAYDLHTVKGREMGRDEMHFLTEASKVEPQMKDEEVECIKQNYIDFCRKEKDMQGKPDVQPFRYNTWQY